MGGLRRGLSCRGCEKFYRPQSRAELADAAHAKAIPTARLGVAANHPKRRPRPSPRHSGSPPFLRRSVCFQRKRDPSIVSLRERPPSRLRLSDLSQFLSTPLNTAL